MKSNRLLLSLLLMLSLLSAAVWLAPAVVARTGSVFEQLDLLVDIRHEIVSEYVEEPDQEKMIRAAVRAMVESLDDPYTNFFLPEEVAEFDKQVRGSFSGIGAEVEVKDNRLRIVSPLEDSPAWKAGVMPGDVVLEIDGHSTEGLNIADCIKRLTGKEGTDVTIRLRHETGEEKTVTITRARIVVETVRGLRRDKDLHWDFMLDKANRIGYLRLTQFTDKTGPAMRAALDELLKQDVRGLILDVRFNPGGMLEAAVEVSDMFLDAGKTIVSVKGRAVPERVTRSSNGGTIPPVPVVVLANEGSASAAEILTGALADNDRALFVGTRTFGKGSVQQVRMLEHGAGALKITNAYYYLPNGRNIHRRPGQDVWGVDPAEGCYVPMTAEQVSTMIKTRSDPKIARPSASAPPVTPQWLEEELKDPQLAAALRAVLGKLDSGRWPTVGQSGATALALETKRATLLRQKDMLLQRLAQIDDELSGKKPQENPDTGDTVDEDDQP